MNTKLTIMDLSVILDVLAETINAPDQNVYKVTREQRTDIANKIQQEMSEIQLAVTRK